MTARLRFDLRPGRRIGRAFEVVGPMGAGVEG